MQAGIGAANARPAGGALPGPFDHPDQVTRVGVFRALQLGDMLCAVPALRALRGHFPAARITLIGLPWAREFARRFSMYIDDCIVFPGYPGLPEQAPDPARWERFTGEVRDRRFDALLQLHGDGRITNRMLDGLGAGPLAAFYQPGLDSPAAIQVPYPDHLPEVLRNLALVEAIGAQPCGTALEFPLGEADHAAAAALLGDDREPYVVVHPGASVASRRWHADRFAAVAVALALRGYRIVFTGSAAEADLVDGVRSAVSRPTLDLAGRTDLGSFAAVVDGAALAIGNDTAISHIAAARSTPSVIVACGSDPRRWAPLDRDLHHVLAEPVPCRPCSWAWCPVRGHPCAGGVGVDWVLAEAETLLQRAAPPAPGVRR